MLGEFFQALLVPSLVGSVLAILLTLARPLTKRVCTSAWHYYIWLAVLFTMLLPVRFPTPQPTAFHAPTAAFLQEEQSPQGTADGKKTVVQASPASAALPKATAKKGGMLAGSKWNILGIIWLAGAVGSLLFYLIGYLRLIKKIHQNSAVTTCPQIAAYTHKNIAVRVGPVFSSPFMTGIVHPTLVLPDHVFSAEQLDNILRHEMTHFRRNDLLYKWFAVLTQCVHWFNPVVYYISRQIRIECEISCDLSVVRQMDKGGKTSYINTILSLLAPSKAAIPPFTTGMTGSKKILKRRFIMIKNRKNTSKFASVLSAIVAAAILSTTVFASGVLSDLAADTTIVEITNNGEKIQLLHQPLIEHGEVYLPLRETLEQAGALAYPGSSIQWNDGVIDLSIASDPNSPAYSTMPHYRMEIGSTILISRFHDLEDNLLREMSKAPVLKDSVTYLPYESIDFIVNYRSNELNLDYRVYDRSGYDITKNSIAQLRRPLTKNEALKLSPDYVNDQMACYDTIQSFFDAFQNGKIEPMKQYGTADFITQAFDGNTFCGISTGSLGTVYWIYLYPDGNYHLAYQLYSNELQSGKEEFEAVLEKQNDGSFLIKAVTSVEMK